MAIIANTDGNLANTEDALANTYENPLSMYSNLHIISGTMSVSPGII